MEQEHALPAFQVVVSERTNYKLGSGRTARKTEGCICYYAEKKDQGQIFIQPLNGKDVPSGKKTFMDDQEFCRRFKPEPLIYYNKVKPAIDSLDQMLDKAERHQKAHRHERACQAYREVMNMDPENLRAIFGLGIASLSMGALDDAQDVFNKLMDLEFDYVSENKHLYNEFGIRMRKGGMHEQALQWYRKALGCCNMDPHLYYNVGRLQYELRDYSMARDSLQKALELEPELEPAVKLLKLAHKALGRQPEQAAA